MKLISLEESNKLPERLLSPEKSQPAMLVQSQRMYAGARVSRLDNDLGDVLEVNRSIYESLKIMRDRSRQLAIDNVHIVAFLRQAVQEILGEKGLKLSVLGPDEKVNELIEKMYDDWSEEEGVTTCGRMNNILFEKLKIQTQHRDGEFLARIIENFDGNSYRFALFPFEADRLELGFDYPPRLLDGSFIQNSIEYDKWLRPMAYHVLERHPGDNVARWPDGKYRMRIPAHEIIHEYDIMRPGQGRGIPATHPVIITATHLAAYIKATIVNMRVIASKFGVITKKELDPHKSDMGTVNEDTGEIINKVEAGRIFRLRGGEDFTMFDPKHPSSEFDPFTRVMKQDMGVGVDLSYADISGDLKGTSFASGRLGALTKQESWGFKRTIHKRMKRRIYTRWLWWAYLTKDKLYNAIKPNELELYMQHYFHDKPVIWIDPGTQAKVVKMNIETKITSLHKELAKLGIDYKNHMEELKQESEDMKEIYGGDADEQEAKLRIIEAQQNGNKNSQRR